MGSILVGTLDKTLGVKNPLSGFGVNALWRIDSIVRHGVYAAFSDL